MTDPQNHVPALFTAQAVAMNARLNQLEDWQVDHMRHQAEALLPADHLMRPQIIRFADRLRQCRRDAYAVRLLGAELQDALLVSLNPDAPTPRHAARHWSDRYDD